MFARVPHKEKAVITGTQNTVAYLRMQKKMGKFYLSAGLPRPSITRTFPYLVLIADK
jgi:hypothetical protein